MNATCPKCGQEWETNYGRKIACECGHIFKCLPGKEAPPPPPPRVPRRTRQLCGEYIRCYMCGKVVPLEDSTHMRGYNVGFGLFGGQTGLGAVSTDRDVCLNCKSGNDLAMLIIGLFFGIPLLAGLGWLMYIAMR